MALTSTFGITFNAVDDAWDDYSVRMTLTPALVENLASIPVGATHVRLTFQSSSSEALTITDAFIGHVAPSGAAYDAADLTRITFNGGSNSIAIPIASDGVSDPLAFTYDQLANLIVTLHVSSTAGQNGTGRLDSVTGFNTYFRVPANEASVLVPNTHTLIGGGNRAYFLSEIEFGTPVIKTFALTVPSLTVGGDLTGFVTKVDLADMPATFWSSVDAAGGYVRVKQGGSVIPFDIVDIDTGTDTGRLYFRADIDELTDNDFQIIVDDSLTALAVDATNGRNAVWQDYEAVYMFESTDDRTGNGHTLTLNSGAAIVGGWLEVEGTDDYAQAAVPKFTNWTMGATTIPSSQTAIETLLAYTEGTADANRAAIVRVNATAWELWNSANGAISNGEAPGTGVRVRTIATHSNTSERSLYTDGTLITDTGVDQRPGGTDPVELNIGCATVNAGTATEAFHGQIDQVYLRDGAVNQDWAAAETLSWETPSSFYDPITLVSNDGAEVYKTTGYSVLNRMDVAEVYKTTGYSVLAPPPPETRTFKNTAYSVLIPPPPLTDAARAFKTTGYSVLVPSGDDPAAAYKYSYLPVVNE